MTLLKSMTYAVIQNPVCLKSDGTPEKTSFGQVKTKINSTEVRTQKEYPDWFPLYPGEVLKGVLEARVARTDQALKIKVIQEYEEDGKTVDDVNSVSSR